MDASIQSDCRLRVSSLGTGLLYHAVAARKDTPCTVCTFRCWLLALGKGGETVMTAKDVNRDGRSFVDLHSLDCQLMSESPPAEAYRCYC